TGRRATAMTFSAATFSQKLGGAMGSALMLAVLASIGYVAREAQSGASQDGIAMLQTIYPGVIAFIAAIIILFYPLNNKKLEQIQHELSVKSAQLEVGYVTIIPIRIIGRRSKCRAL